MALKSPSLASGVAAVDYPQQVIPLDKIVCDEKNPRLKSKSSAAKFDELVESIRRDGILQPPLVYQKGQAFHIVFGNRRVQAVRRMGLVQTVFRVLDHMPDEVERQRLRDTENLRRLNLNHAEEGIMVVQSAQANGGDLAKTALEFGEDETWVRDRLYLQRLGPKVREMLAAGRINLGQARELVKVGDLEDQLDLAEVIAVDDVRGSRVYTREEVRGMVENKKRSLRVVQWRTEVAFAGKRACVGCPSNTATDVMLFGTSKDEAEKGCCLNQSCFEAKGKAVMAAQERAVKEVGQLIKKKELGKDDAGGVEVARGQTPAFMKEETVQRALKREFKPAEAKEGGGGKKASEKTPGKKLTELERRQAAILKWGEHCRGIEGLVNRKIQDLTQKDPAKALLAMALHSSELIDKARRRDYPFSEGSFTWGEWKGKKAPTPDAATSPAIAGILNAERCVTWEGLLEIAGGARNAQMFQVQDLPPDIIDRVVKAFGLDPVMHLAFEDFLPEDLRPKLRATPPAAMDGPDPRITSLATAKWEEVDRGATFKPGDIATNGMVLVKIGNQRQGTKYQVIYENGTKGWLEPGMMSHVGQSEEQEFEAAQKKRQEKKAGKKSSHVSDVVEAELRDALHSFEGAESRWELRKKTGRTDAELKDDIAEEFGINGSSGGPGRTGNSHRGGRNPAFWLGADSRKKPTLIGRALIDAVRAVMSVPSPG